MCGGQWETGQYEKYDHNLLKDRTFSFKTEFQIGSGARYGCCPPGKFMSSPFLNPFSEIHSCKSCPAEFSSAFTNVKNDEITCNGKCPKGMYYVDVFLGCQHCEAGKFNNVAGTTGSIIVKNMSVDNEGTAAHSLNSERGSSSCLECSLGNKYIVISKRIPVFRAHNINH